MKKLIAQRIDLDKNRYVAVAKTPDGCYQINSQNKIKTRRWKTCICKRDENNIVTTTIKFSSDGAAALMKLLYDELLKEYLASRGETDQSKL